MPHQNINQIPNVYIETFITFCSIAMAFVSNSSSSKDNQNSSGKDLAIINTEDEMCTDTTNWTPAKWKKLQHMTEFYEEYQWIFGAEASLHTIMKRRISHMNPPMPDSVCKEEMQNATVENDREYLQHVHSDDNLLDVPEDNFVQKREVTGDSYSETISFDSSSDDHTITADSDSSTSSMEDKTCAWETNSTGIEPTLHQTASGLQNAAEEYMTLASHISKLASYELLQIIVQIPPPPVDIPILIRKALSMDGEDKVINYLLCKEYEMTNTSWSKLQEKYNLSKNKVYSALKGKRRPRGSQYQQKRKQTVQSKPTTSHTNSETE